jgi:CubicO group peptidase (beta-lactamase class C family)
MKNVFYSLLLGLGACFNVTAQDSAPLTTNLDPLLGRVFSLDLAPGMAVAVVDRDRLVYERGFGLADLERNTPVTPDTLFYIASTTKSFTALAAALLDEQGLIDLDASLSSYIPSLAFRSPLSADKISLRDLLTHTHGIRQTFGPVVVRTAYTGEFTNGQLIRLLGEYEASPQGRVYQYGNLGYNIAALALETALGVGWKELIEREVLAPLAMLDTTAYRSAADPNRFAMPYRAESHGMVRIRYAKDDANMHAAGGHLTTVRDLAKYLEAHINLGRVKGDQVFSAAAIMETHRQQAEQDRNYGPFHRHGWGLGWDLGTYDGETIVHRFGGFSGFHSHLSFMPEPGIGVAVLVNESDLGSRLANAVSTTIYNEMLAKPELRARQERLFDDLVVETEELRERSRGDNERRAARAQVLPYLIDAYVGTYENDRLGRMHWTLEGGELHVTFGLAESDVEVYDGAQNQLRVELLGGGSVVTFLFEEDRATGLAFVEHMFDRIEP